MSDIKSLIEKMKSLSDEEMEDLLLEALDYHLATTTSALSLFILTDEEEAIFESMGFPSDSKG